MPEGWQACVGSDLAKIVGIICVGMPASLLVTAQVAVLIRSAVRTTLEDTPPSQKLPPFAQSHYLAWGAAHHPLWFCQY